jgi:hypothetical protein
LPEEFTVVEKLEVLPSGAVSLLVTVAFGVAAPDRVTLVSPTTGLLGDRDPVSVAPEQGKRAKSVTLNKSQELLVATLRFGKNWPPVIISTLFQIQ